MGQPDLFAKRIYAQETHPCSAGLVRWEDPPEIRLEKIQADGYLRVPRPGPLFALPPPWREISGYAEILLEIKMPRDHVDVQAVERALLRRQARQVQRVEASGVWPGPLPLWIVAPHLPAWVPQQYELCPVSEGCYRLGASNFPWVWIAANELPLLEPLIPFLVVRSGRALDEFGLWVAERRPFSWVMDMLQSTSMSASIRDEIMERFGTPTDDPEVRERRRHIVKFFLRVDPELRQHVIDESRVEEARSALCSVLERRGFTLTAMQLAQIEGCSDLGQLHRWLDQAVTAGTPEEALR